MPCIPVSLSETFGVGEIATVDINLDDLGTNVSDYASVLDALQAAADALSLIHI